VSHRQRVKAWFAMRVAGVEVAVLLAVIPLGAGILLFTELAEEALEGESL
jgi:hypothetical protein